MHQSTVAKKNHAENQATFPGVYAIFLLGHDFSRRLSLGQSHRGRSVNWGEFFWKIHDMEMIS